MVVDDERDIRESLGGVLSDEGYNVVAPSSAEEGLAEILKNPPDLVLLDIWMPVMDGVDVLTEIKGKYPNLPVIMISGHGSIETAVKTTKLGAYDFIEKPLSIDKVVLTIEHALEQKRLLEENIALREKARENYEIIGNSEAIQKLREDIQKVSPTNSWVLITGENGTGKEIVARNIHLFSERFAKPFVAVNCAAIPEELIESELFGHEKGAFTGAVSRKKGKFDMADGGTLFLDEIGDMSLKTQAKVLRILQERNFERVGGTEKISVDVRVVAATNKNLEEEMRKGNFREDLYYRLNVIPFYIPPVRERAEDIALFVDYYFREFSLDTGKEVPAIDPDAMKALINFDWPGNVREIKNLVERLVIMATSGVITLDDLPHYFRGTQHVHEQSLFVPTLKEAKRDFEKEFILRKLQEFGGNMAKTAEAIGIERSHLYRKVKSYGIDLKGLERA
jgi:two-component system nitrogen regulation response regulator NtrX